MGVTHLGMRMISGGQANAEFAPRPDGRSGHGGHGGAGHMLGSLLIVGVVGTAVAQVSQRTRRPRRSLISAYCTRTIPSLRCSVQRKGGIFCVLDLGKGTTLCYELKHVMQLLINQTVIDI
jgi:hypothetical protein